MLKVPRARAGDSRRISFEVARAFAEIVCRQLIQINAFIVSTSQIARIVGAITMAHLADKLHVNKQKIGRVESAVLLSLIVSGLGLCVFGAAVYDIGRAFSVW
jgi:MFS family permease